MGAASMTFIDLYTYFSVLGCHQILIQLTKIEAKKVEKHWCSEWGSFYLLIADFFATQIIGGAKEFVVLL